MGHVCQKTPNCGCKRIFSNIRVLWFNWGLQEMGSIHNNPMKTTAKIQNLTLMTNDSKPKRDSAIKKPKKVWDRENVNGNYLRLSSCRGMHHYPSTTGNSSVGLTSIPNLYCKLMPWGLLQVGGAFRRKKIISKMGVGNNWDHCPSLNNSNTNSKPICKITTEKNIKISLVTCKWMLPQ